MTSTSLLTLRIPARFNGPTNSGNGGWSAGAMAELIGHRTGITTTVQLRQPPPLDVDMAVETVAGWSTASHRGRPALRAASAGSEPTPVPAVTLEQARAASAAYAGLRSHPFPGCFVCGVDRAEGDGLRIFPGRVGDSGARARVATTWTPSSDHDDSPLTTVPLTWAALDCIGGWAGDLGERAMVMGTMSTIIHTLPEAGVEHVVVGAARSTEGRKTFTASTLYAPGGAVVATAAHVWIAVDPKDFP